MVLETEAADNRVALLAEGVDRNNKAVLEKRLYDVALLAEGVDRNSSVNSREQRATRRPPRGGRG